MFELRAQTANPGTIAILTGYYQAGDEGGGLFYWDPNPAADDGGTILNSAGLGSNTSGWRRLYSGAINVKWFGADGTDNANDIASTTASINRAIAVAMIANRPVFFPVGIYRINAGIVIGGRVTLQGSPKMQWPNSPASCIRAGAAMPFVVQVAASGVELDDLWLDGNFSAENVLSLAQPSENCTYSNLLVTRCIPFVPSDLTKANLVTVAAGSTTGIDAQVFRQCAFIQDPLGQSMPGAVLRGHACVSNYFPGVGTGGSENAFRWLFDDHCTFEGQKYGYRTKWGGASFCHSEFYDMEVALFATELGQPLLVLDCYTEPGQGRIQTTFPDILIQEETVQGPSGSNPAEINFTHCQFNTPGARFLLNGKAPVRVDGCLLNSDIVITPAASGANMPITVVGCSFPPGDGVQNPSSYRFLSLLGNCTSGVGVQENALQNIKVGGTVFDGNSGGGIIINDPATTATVTFAVPEPDTSYRVIVGVANASQPSAAKAAYAYALTTTGFTIGLSGPMGAGQSCAVFWQMTR